MQIKTEQSAPNTWSVQLAGRLDPASAGEARQAFAAIPADAAALTLDLKRLSYISLAGLRELLIARRRFPAGDIRLERLRPRVLETLKSSGFSDFFELGEAVPEDLPGTGEALSGSFRDFLAEKRQNAADRVAIVSEAGEHSWREIDACAELIAADLAALGVRRGSHVAICGRNSVNWVYTFFAIQKLGAVAALINPGLKAAEIAKILRGGDIELLCYGEILEMKEEAAFLDKIRQAAGEKLKGFYDVRSSRDFRARIGERAACPMQTVEADDPALMIFTSGYTGTPKGVLLSAYSVLRASRASAGTQHLTERDRICLILPMFHIFGLVAGLIAGSCADALIYLPKDIRTGTILNLIHTERCTVFHSVPSMLVALVNNRDFSPEKLSSLRCTIISAAAATRAQMERFQNAMPENHFLSSYGLSEMAPVSITDYEDTDEHVMRTVGRLLEHVALRIADPATGEDCPAGEPGEILVQGYSLMGGYYRIAIEEQAIDADGWLHTGDRGCLDEEGYLHLDGRYKELIIRGGENVMPGEIETALTELPGVRNAKVIGVPSDFFGEEVCACLVCGEGESFDEDAARAELSERLARYKVPSFFLLYEELPLLGSGKIDIVTLKQDAIIRVNAMKK